MCLVGLYQFNVLPHAVYLGVCGVRRLGYNSLQDWFVAVVLAVSFSGFLVPLSSLSLCLSLFLSPSSLSGSCRSSLLNVWFEWHLDMRLLAQDL